MRRVFFLICAGFLFWGCRSDPVKEKHEARQEQQPDPYKDNTAESEESDEEKGYFDRGFGTLRDAKDVKKQSEEAMKEEKEALEEADNEN